MSTYRAHRAPSRALIVAVVAVAVVLVVAIVGLFVAHKPDATAGSSGRSGTHDTSSSGSQVATEALASTSPKQGATNVSPEGPITLNLTEPLASGSPMPSISPNVDGSWALTSSTTLTFEPKASLVPFQTYTVTVPGGSDGLRGASGTHLASSVHFKFKVAAGSFLRLQQLLAELEFLPVAFAPQSTAAVPATQMAMPQVGNFNWRWSGMPSQLTSLFLEGGDDVLTQGAVMTFEEMHGLTPDGIAGPDVWTDLLQAAAQHQVDPNPWNWVYVQKTPEPEMVYVWSDGKQVFSTVANTGAVGFVTPDGSWPVYEHFPSTEMKGTNPDGQPYDDKNVLWVSYFYDGDALHAFLRGSYGTPQSLGCVEMPTSAAQTVYPYTPIGTVVTIQ